MQSRAYLSYLVSSSHCQQTRILEDPCPHQPLGIPIHTCVHQEQIPNHLGLHKNTGSEKARKLHQIPCKLSVKCSIHCHTVKGWELHIIYHSMQRQMPRETWQRMMDKEREHLSFKTWREAEVAAQDWVAWRRRTHGPILHEERRKKMMMMMRVTYLVIHFL